MNLFKFYEHNYLFCQLIINLELKIHFLSKSLEIKDLKLLKIRFRSHSVELF